MPAKDPKAYAAAHYQNNKGKYAAQSKAARLRRREWFNGIMSDKSCERCGESDVACLDWHHTDPSEKEHPVSWLMKNRSRKAILEEIDKCICLCSNCHRKLHYYGA
jgi:hypothetical protein